MRNFLKTNNLEILFILSLPPIFISCDGILGGFTVVSFPVSKQKLEIALDSLYSSEPKYVIPSKWKEYDSWSKRGFDFLDSRIYYFNSNPEEMYYVSFIGEKSTFKDTTHIEISIRSVFVKQKRDWLKQEDFDEAEIKRIELRFKKEIISKLERYTNSKSKDLDC